VNRAQQKNEELTVNKEVLMNHAAKLETSLQDMSNDREFWKNNELNLQQTIDEARKRKQVRIVCMFAYMLASNISWKSILIYSLIWLHVSSSS
jgi:hypothetical protein